MSTINSQKGAYTALSVASLQSLANSATNGWQSARVDDQTTTKALDYEIFVKLTTAGTSPGNDKAMYVYVCPMMTTDGGTTWLVSDAGVVTLPSGTESLYSINTPNNLKLLGVLSYTTAAQPCQAIFNMSTAVGQSMPDGFSIIIINYSGSALATACVVAYRAVTLTNT